MFHLNAQDNNDDA